MDPPFDLDIFYAQAQLEMLYKMAQRCAERRTNPSIDVKDLSRFCSLVKFSWTTGVGEENSDSPALHTEFKATFHEPGIQTFIDNSLNVTIELKLTVSDIEGPGAVGFDHLVVRYQIPLHCAEYTSIALPGTPPTHEPIRCMFLNFRETTFLGAFKEKNSPSEAKISKELQRFFVTYGQALPSTGIDTLVFFPLLCPKSSPPPPEFVLPALYKINLYFASAWAWAACAIKTQKESLFKLDVYEGQGVNVHISRLEFSAPEIRNIRAEQKEVDLILSIKKVFLKEHQRGDIAETPDYKDWKVAFTAPVLFETQGKTTIGIKLDFSQTFRYRHDLSSTNSREVGKENSYYKATVSIIETDYIERLKSAGLETIFRRESMEKNEPCLKWLGDLANGGFHWVIALPQELINDDLDAMHEQEASIWKNWEDGTRFWVTFAKPELQLLNTTGKAILRLYLESFGFDTDGNARKSSPSNMKHRKITLAFEVGLALWPRGWHWVPLPEKANATRLGRYACVRINLIGAQLRPSGTGGLSIDGDATAMEEFRDYILPLLRRLTQDEGYFGRVSQDHKATDLVRIPLPSTLSPHLSTTLDYDYNPGNIDGQHSNTQLSTCNQPTPDRLWITVAKDSLETAQVKIVPVSPQTLYRLFGCDSDSSPWILNGFFALGGPFEYLQNLVIESLAPLNARTTLIPDVSNALIGTLDLASLRLRTWDDIDKEQLRCGSLVERTSRHTQLAFVRSNDSAHATGPLEWKYKFLRNFGVGHSDSEVKVIRCVTDNRLSIEKVNLKETANFGVKIQGRVTLTAGNGRLDKQGTQGDCWIIDCQNQQTSTMTWNMTFAVDAVRSIYEGKLWRSGNYQLSGPKFVDPDDKNNSSRQALNKLIPSWKDDVQVESLFHNADTTRVDIGRLGRSVFNERGDIFIELRRQACATARAFPTDLRHYQQPPVPVFPSKI
ncbi:hypothetical protein C8Q78DRAFT_995903 [Trametes maxima]|nr:hypothetical protein C8Q78DRAFT_995903 [Trametes maxima]